ncbi:MAG: carbohydrate ABC transporter permease [Spirochaetaceae bacterium]|jgi:multiple sugar transport system permease protein|nr:carbohydrate ABC transporter permease [Spirochaetaceae bacterium]
MKKLASIISMILFFTVSLLWFFPFIWIFLSALKTYPETVRLPIHILPESFTFMGNFNEILGRLHFLSYYRNNVIVTLGILVPQILLSSMAAYGFARIDFPCKNGIFTSLFLAIMVPLQMVLMPRYNMMLAFGWLNSFLGVIVPLIPSVVCTFLIRQQILSLPKSLDESAIIDGASHWRIYRSIIMPLSQSSLLATGIMCMVFAWNNFLWPLIVINEEKLYTLSIATANLQGQMMTRENLLMTAALLVSLPVILVFLFAQKHFIAGIALTGLKE